MTQQLQQTHRVGVALKVSAIIFLLAIGGWAVTAFQGATADSLPIRTSVQLSTEHLSYPLGQSIQFTLSNHGQQPVTLPSQTPFSIMQGSEVIYQPFDDATPTTLAAGKSLNWEWDQRDALGDAVTPGTYQIGIGYNSGDSTAVVQTSVFLTNVASLPDGFEVAPTSGTVPLQVSVRCPAKHAPVVVTYGDESDSVLLSDCPESVSHTYQKAGTLSLTLRSGTTTIGTQPITVIAPVASTVGSNWHFPLGTSAFGTLLITLLSAAVASGLISYFIIGRPTPLRR